MRPLDRSILETPFFPHGPESPELKEPGKQTIVLAGTSWAAVTGKQGQKGISDADGRAIESTSCGLQLKLEM